MAIRLNALKTTELSPRIVVFGVGGAGGNAVNNMIEDELQGVDFVVANTDSQALARSKAERRIQIGLNTTQGLGAGANPQVGMAAAEESQSEIMEQLSDAHMVFITAGMGGGTGTGAAPTIARIAREMEILTVAVVTKPFHFEGPRRMAMADAGLAELQKNVDTLIVIPNQNLFRVANDKTTFQAAFQMADEVLHKGVRGVTDLMIMPGIINLDFADVRSVMSGMGKAMMGTGEASGEKRAIEAANAAINNPLLEDVSLKGAKAVLINITGGHDMTLYEFEEAASAVKAEVDPNANIIVGSTYDESMEGKLRVSVVASGIDIIESEMPAPNSLANQSTGFGQKPAPSQPVQVVRVGRDAAPQPIVQPTVAPQYAPPPMAQAPAHTPTIQAKEEALFDDMPQVRRPYVRPQAESNMQPRYAPTTQAPEARSNAAPEPRRGLDLMGIFGTPKPRAQMENMDYEEARAEHDPFQDEVGDDYSIPAFLRRQAN
jgi:cell division protein FtsZ